MGRPRIDTIQFGCGEIPSINVSVGDTVQWIGWDSKRKCTVVSAILDSNAQALRVDYPAAHFTIPLQEATQYDIFIPLEADQFQIFARSFATTSSRWPLGGHLDTQNQPGGDCQDIARLTKALDAIAKNDPEQRAAFLDAVAVIHANRSSPKLLPVRLSEEAASLQALWPDYCRLEVGGKTTEQKERFLHLMAVTKQTGEFPSELINRKRLRALAQLTGYLVQLQPKSNAARNRLQRRIEQRAEKEGRPVLKIAEELVQQANTPHQK